MYDMKGKAVGSRATSMVGSAVVRRLASEDCKVMAALTFPPNFIQS